MGRFKKLWKRTKKIFRNKKVLSAIVGGTVGFLIGGPVGAITMATASVACAVTHDAVAVQIDNVPIYTVPPPQPRATSRTSDQELIERSIIIQSNITPMVPIVEKNSNEKKTTDGKETTDNQNPPKKHNRILEVVGKILQTSVEANDHWDSMINGESGPRYSTSNQDSIEMAQLKTRANYLMDLIETQNGEDPIDDFTRGSELISVSKKIKNLEQKKLCCPVCNGTRFVYSGETTDKIKCDTCFGNGFILQ